MEQQYVGQGGVDNQSSFESARNHSLRSQESDPDMGKGPISNNNGPSIITKSSSSSLLGTQTSEKQQQPYADGDGDGDGHTNLNNAISSNPTNRNVDEGGESNEQKKSQHITNNDEKYVQEDAEEYKVQQTSPKAEVTENPYEDNDGEESEKEGETPYEDNDGEESEKEAETPYEDNDGEKSKQEAKTGAIESHEEEKNDTARDNVVSDKEVDSPLKESRIVKGVSFGAQSKASRKPLKTKSSASSARPLLPPTHGMASDKHEELPDHEDDEHKQQPSSSSGSEGKPWGSSLWIPAIVGGIIAAFIFGKVKFSHRRKQPHSDAL